MKTRAQLWCVFKNGSSVYALVLGDSKGIFSGGFCVARKGGDPASLQDGLNWACGQGHVNNTAILSGQPCYMTNTDDAVMLRIILSLSGQDEKEEKRLKGYRVYIVLAKAISSTPLGGLLSFSLFKKGVRVMDPAYLQEVQTQAPVRQHLDSEYITTTSDS
ncbi:hypothetical protein Tco_1540304 [Tanacetum coccineum]